MNNIIRETNALSLEGPNSPQALLDLIEATEEKMMQFAYYHGVTSSASTFSQFVAMSVLLEGRSGKESGFHTNNSLYKTVPQQLSLQINN